MAKKVEQWTSVEIRVELVRKGVRGVMGTTNVPAGWIEEISCGGKGFETRVRVEKASVIMEGDIIRLVVGDVEDGPREAAPLNLDNGPLGLDCGE